MLAEQGGGGAGGSRDVLGLRWALTLTFLPFAGGGGGGGGDSGVGVGNASEVADLLRASFEQLRLLAAGQQALLSAARQPASPTNPAQLAHVTLETLQRVPGGIRVLGDADAGADADGPSVLSAAQQSCFRDDVGAAATRKEKALVRLMTPILCDLRLPRAEAAPEAGAAPVADDPCIPLLVNSEEVPWLVHPSSSGLPGLRQKPDLFRSWAPFVELRDGGGSDQGDGPQFVFGGLAGYALQAAGCAAELYEAKVRLAERDFGELCAYQQCVPGRCFGMLFDLDDFWLFESFSGNPVRLIKGAWTAAGSLACVRRFYADAPEPPLAILLRELLRALRLKSLAVRGSCYLGSGAHGHVFRVGSEAEPMALKVALVPLAGDLYLIEAEFEHMRAAWRRGAPVVPPVEGSLRVLDLGGGYLMQNVGRRFEVTSATRCTTAFCALAHLHKCGVVHGDPRIPNLLLVGTEALWVDLRGSAVVGALGAPSVHSARADAACLARSILTLEARAPLPVAAEAALARYEPAVAESVTALAAAVWKTRSGAL